jgi:tocopherol O-methyltransferase
MGRDPFLFGHDMITPHEPQDAARVAEHYDQLHRLYLELWGEHLHHGLWSNGHETPAQAVLQLVTAVAQEGLIGAGTRVCDVGCGYGATARLLAREYGAQVTGISLSQAQVEHARRVDPDAANPRYLRGDWLGNDFREGAFEAVLAIESSEHMVDKPRCFAEAARVLAPGGRLVVCAWLARQTPTGAEVRWLLEPICREGRLPSMGSEQDYRELIAGAGLELVRFQDVSARVKKTWPICAYRVARGMATRRDYRALLMDRRVASRVFALTVFRIWAAYELGSMRYGIFTARKPSTGT